MSLDVKTLEKDTTKTIFTSARSFFYGTFLSRISGLLRDMSLAFFLGSSAELAAFMVAFRLSNLFRRLFGEGSMHAGFVPYYEAIRAKDKQMASMFYRDLFFSFVYVLLFILLITETFFHILGFASLSYNNQQILYFVKLMLPGLIFICLYSLNSSLLQCSRSYFLPAIAPCTFNIVWIISLYFFKNETGQNAAIILSVVVVFAFFIQWFFTVPKATSIIFKDITFLDWFKAKPFSPLIRRMMKPLALGIIGVGAVQINSALDVCFARAADLSGPAYLWYAIRLHQLPIALFSIAISGALFPPLARAYENNDKEKFSIFLKEAIIKSISLMLIATAAIFALGGSAINLIYGRGQFSNVATIQTLYCLWCYSIGLVFSSLSLIFSNAFYSKKKFFLPMMASLFSVIVNILFNTYFVYSLHLGAASIALATSISSCVNFIFLYRCFKKDDITLLPKKIFFKTIRITIVCFVTAIIVIYISSKIFYDPTMSLLLNKGESIFSRNLLKQIFYFSGISLIFVITLIALALIFRSKEILKWVMKSKS